MNLIPFPEQTLIIAKDQPQYNPMPAHLVGDATGTVHVLWKLTWRERLIVLFGGKIWHSIWTFNQQMQPQLLSVYQPEMKFKDETHN